MRQRYSYPVPDAVLRNGTAPVRTGSHDGHSHVKGDIDDVCIYNRALCGTEIADLYHAPAD